MPEKKNRTKITNKNCSQPLSPLPNALSNVKVANDFYIMPKNCENVNFNFSSKHQKQFYFN